MKTIILKILNLKFNHQIKLLKENSKEYLTPDGLITYSPKFLNVLNNIENPKNNGLHLIYSQFRTLEGIGILKFVLEANGYAHFKKTLAYKSEMDVMVESNPYITRNTVNADLSLKLNLKLMNTQELE